MAKMMESKICDQCGDELYDADNYDPNGGDLRCNDCIKRIDDAVRKQYALAPSSAAGGEKTAPQEAAEGGWNAKQVREAAETIMAICQGERDCADAMEEYGTIIVQSAMHRDAELLARYVLETIPQEAGR